MVNLVYVLLGEMRRHEPEWSVLDLTAFCRGYTYVLETINSCQQYRRQNGSEVKGLW